MESFSLFPTSQRSFNKFKDNCEGDSAVTKACIFMFGAVAHFQGMQLHTYYAIAIFGCYTVYRKRDKGSGSSGGIVGVEVDRFPDPLSMGHKKSSGEPVSTSGVEEEEEEVEEEEAAAVGP